MEITARGLGAATKEGAAAAVTAVTQGVSRVVSIRVASGLDTHYDNWTTDNGPTQESGFNIVARMIEDLESRPYGDGTSWLDHTTIVGFSEFCRGSMVNANLGRDHSLTNACFLAGGNIRGGQVIGASDPKGGEPADRPVYLGEIFATLYRNIGIDVTEEQLQDLSGRPQYLVDNGMRALPELVG